MRAVAAWLVAVPLAAQVVPVGVVRGELLEWEGTSQSGVLVIRTQNASVYRCDYDVRTYAERDAQRMSIGALRTKDKLEVIADQRNGKCYARTIRVTDERAPVLNPGYRVNLRPPYRSTADTLYPRGNLTFAGVILRINPHVMVLRTRNDGEKTVRLRQDTRYLESGFPSEHATLAVNTRVFIRGGKNLEDEIEAYQVVWGEIAGPKPLW
jgi:hypothetical protein